MKRNHTKRLKEWNAAVKRRRIQIMKEIIRVQNLRRRGVSQTKAKARLANLEFYGVFEGFTKIKGAWGKG